MRELSGGSERAFEATIFHLFAGIGGGAKGFRQARVECAGMSLRFRCLGGIDSDPEAMEDFRRLAGVPGTVMDLFSRDQYERFHGRSPPTGWREMRGEDILTASRGEHPDVVFLSAPCRGLSGLVTNAQAATAKYQALNELTLRGIWLMLDAYAGSLPSLVVFENVPRISSSRGRRLLDQIGGLLRASGYDTRETTHCCGELAGLAQRRRRFLLVARLASKVPARLYVPERKRLRGIGEVIGAMPLPDDPAAGPMHRTPWLHFSTWIRLALVEAGSDWRSLARLRVSGGELADYGIVAEQQRRNGFLGVNRWDEPLGVIAGRSHPCNGNFSVADWRASWHGGNFDYRIVRRANGATAIEAPSPGDDQRHGAGVRRWDQNMGVVTGQRSPLQNAMSVADPRPTETNQGRGKYRVTGWDEPAGTVISESHTGNGASAVADDRWKARDAAADGAGAMPELPAPNQRVLAVIRAEDGTWHRPLTTAELAVLQSLVEPHEVLELSGASDASWRTRVGNAVPPAAARAIAEEMGRTLLMAHTGETFKLSEVPIWVRGVAAALAIDPAGHLGHDPELGA